MYYPVPGHTHLKVLLPTPASSRSAPPVHRTARPIDDPLVTSPLITMALDATFGIRDIRALQKRAFAPIVRTYVRARRIGGLPPGHVRVATSRQRGQEFFGTAVSAGTRYAWVARIKADRLVSFRVL